MLDAVVNFYAVPENSRVPSGSFRACGAYFRSGELDLCSDEPDWIEPPGSYLTVDFLGAISPDGSYFAGDVIGNTGCTTFHATRQ